MAKSSEGFYLHHQGGRNRYHFETANYSRDAPVSSRSQPITQYISKASVRLSKKNPEQIHELVKESFYCTHYPRSSSGCSNCSVECKRRDGKPLGYDMVGEHDDCGRRAFVFESPPPPRSSGDDDTHGGPILVHVREIPFSYGKLGGTIWYAAVAFAQYIAANPSMVQGKKVLELGAGLGLPGLVAGISGGRVTLSEFGYEGKVDGELIEKSGEKRLIPSALIDNLRYNTALNNLSSSVDIRHLDWYDYVDDNNLPEEEEKYDLIIGSDLINWEDDVTPLISTLKYFLSRKEGSKAVIAMSSENRRGLPMFLDIIKKQFAMVDIEEQTIVHYDEHPILLITMSMCTTSCRKYQYS